MGAVYITTATAMRKRQAMTYWLYTNDELSSELSHVNDMLLRSLLDNGSIIQYLRYPAILSDECCNVLHNRGFNIVRYPLLNKTEINWDCIDAFIYRMDRLMELRKKCMQYYLKMNTFNGKCDLSMDNTELSVYTPYWMVHNVTNEMHLVIPSSVQFIFHALSLSHGRISYDIEQYGSVLEKQCTSSDDKITHYKFYPVFDSRMAGKPIFTTNDVSCIDQLSMIHCRLMDQMDAYAKIDNVEVSSFVKLDTMPISDVVLDEISSNNIFHVLRNPIDQLVELSWEERDALCERIRCIHVKNAVLKTCSNVNNLIPYSLYWIRDNDKGIMQYSLLLEVADNHVLFLILSTNKMELIPMRLFTDYTIYEEK